MPYYDLWIASENRQLEPQRARDRDDALEIFGRELSVRLTLEDQGVVAPYMLGESQDNIHWAKATIPVYEISN
jgi:hypothetical protein